MKQVILPLCLLGIVTTTACGGRSAHPVECTKFYDKDLSCAELRLEIQSLEDRIQQLLPKSSKAKKNVALGVGGLIFPPAIFFMDLKNAEKTELAACRSRYDHLVRLYQHKCSNQDASKKQESVPQTQPTIINNYTIVK